MYLAHGTRPDIAQATAAMARFTSNPGSDHVKGVKRILRYIKGTWDAGVRYTRGGGGLTAFADSDYAGDEKERRSTSGYIVYMAGGPVSWASRLQGCVSLSTTEAEYVALCEVTKEIVWLQDMLEGLQLYKKETVTVFQDNQSTIALATNSKVSRRSKHIEVKYHYVRKAVERKVITITYCPTERMLADIMTKPLPETRFAEMASRIVHSPQRHWVGVLNCNGSGVYACSAAHGVGQPKKGCGPRS
jgi:hypothetical protein